MSFDIYVTILNTENKLHTKPHSYTLLVSAVVVIIIHMMKKYTFVLTLIYIAGECNSGNNNTYDEKVHICIEKVDI